MLPNSAARPRIDQNQTSLARHLTSAHPTEGKGARRKKGASKKKDGHRLDRVEREEGGSLGIEALTRDDRQPQSSAAYDPYEICEQPPGHRGGTFTLKDAPFRTDERGRTVPPAYTDVVQGTLADTWLLTAFAAVAQTQPKRLIDRVDVIKDGMFSILLGDQRLQITAEFPTEGYADTHPNGLSDTLWVALLEKAFAMRAGSSFLALEAGNPARALETLTGTKARRLTMSAHRDPKPAIRAAWEAHRHSVPMVVTAGAQNTYAIVAMEEIEDGFHIQLYDPKTPRDLVTCQATDLVEFGARLYIGSR